MHCTCTYEPRCCVSKGGKPTTICFGSGCSEGQPLTDGAVLLQTARAKREELPTLRPESLRRRKDHRSSASTRDCQDRQAASGPAQRRYSTAQSCIGSESPTLQSICVSVRLMMHDLLTVAADE